MTIVYREDDPISSRWAGLGRLLTKYEMDLNHYQFDTRITTLESNYAATVSLATITQPTPSSLLFTLTDATTQGPFDIPVSTFTDQGDWAIDTPYLVNDTFNAPNGGLYRVIFNHTSSHTSFDPAANDGMGHDYYAAMIPPRGNTIPAGGAVAMYFRKNSTTDYDANWAFVRATEVVFAPSSDSALTATNVADAIEQLELLIPTSFDASVISYTPTAWLTATNIDDALDQLANINALHVAFSPTTDSALISTNVGDAIVEVALLASGGGTPLLAANNLSDVANIAAARSSLGLDTANNPQFATVELGHASDTTLSRSAAGVMAVEGKNVILKGHTEDLSTAGYTSTSVSSGTKSSGTYTFDPTAGGVQHITNGGAFTLAPPSSHGGWILDITNNGSAGAITTSGWTKVDGDAFDTTNTHAFRCAMSVGNAGSYLSVKRMA